MKMILLCLLAVAVGSTVANYTYQAFGAGDYIAAAERTYFGVLTLLEAALVIWLSRFALAS